jgi:DNA topoisomerase-3
MKLIITEKPSVAQDIAKVFSNSQRKDGYIETNEYSITWAFGHLIEISKLNAPQRWDLSNLPILPGSFSYDVVKDKTKQFNTIKALLRNASEVVIATDSGREGELIARLILNQSLWKNWENTFRFWSSQALSEQVVKSEMRNLKPAKNYDSLYFSALARQQSDWLCGINLTQLISLRSGAGQVWSVGRVQTPTLALIVHKDKLRRDFIKEEYYVIKAHFKVRDQKYIGIYRFGEQPIEQPEVDKDEITNPKQLLKKDQAEKVIRDIQSTPTGIIKQVKKEDKQETPPLLHSLTSLQQEANRVHSFSASKTLDIAQALYETHKVCSYPRTESQHLGEAGKELARSVLLKLSKTELAAEVDKVGKRVFDDSKLSDHHALIPLQAPSDKLSEDERKIYILIARKFTGAFMQLYKFQRTTLITEVKGHEFLTTGTTVSQWGWKGLYREDKTTEELLPQVIEGEIVKNENSEQEQKFTQPPSPFTESSLLKRMESLSMGTPATRASIIETLITRQYIVREKKNLIPTDKGIELITILKESQISSPEMTGEWEKRLEEIYKGNKGLNGYSHFLGDIKLFVSEQVNKYKNVQVSRINKATPAMLTLAKKLSKERKLNLESEDFDYIKNFIDTTLKTPVNIGKCTCGKEIKENEKAFHCDCGKLVWKEIASKKITPKQAVDLIYGKTITVKGLKNKEKKKFTANLTLGPENKIQFSSIVAN